MMVVFLYDVWADCDQQTRPVNVKLHQKHDLETELPEAVPSLQKKDGRCMGPLRSKNYSAQTY